MKRFRFLLFSFGILGLGSCYEEAPPIFIENTGDILILKDTLSYFDSISIIDYRANLPICNIKFIQNIRYLQISKLLLNKCNIEYRDSSENWKFQIFVQKQQNIYFYNAFTEDLKKLEAIRNFAPFP